MKASLLVMVSRMYNAIVFRALSEAVVNKYNVALANDIEFYPQRALPITRGEVL